MHYLKTEIEDAEKSKFAKSEKRAGLLRFALTACTISRYSGLRLGDICQLEWDCFAKQKRMIVWTDKRDAQVDLPLTTELAAAVAGIPIEHKTYCFPEQRECIMSKQRARLSVHF